MSDEVVSSEASGGNSGPLTFEQAFAADSSPTSAPASETPESAQPAVAAESETAVPGHTGEDQRSPFIPRQRFDEVNTKLNELKQWKEQRAWAEQVDAPAFNQMAQWFLRAQTDTRGFTLQLLDELASHPEHGPAIRSELARRLGTRPQGQNATAPEAEPSPDVDITDANGNVVGRTFSAEALARRDAFRESQLLQRMQQQFEPHLKTLDGIKQKEQALELKAQADAFGSDFAKELSKLPLFDQHKAEIADELRKVQLASGTKEEVRAATFEAYHRIVLPKLQNGTQQTVLADLQRKAAASTSVNPATAKATTPKAYRSFHDLPPDAWA